MEIFLSGCFFVLLLMHRFLSVFWEQGNLPYNLGFVMHLWLFFIAVLINSIYYFGWIFGLILFFLTIFQVVFFLYLRPILFILLQIYTKMPASLDITSFPPKIRFNSFAMAILSLWGWIIPIFLIVSIVNLFMHKYLMGIEIINNIGLNNVIKYTVIYVLIGQFIIWIVSLYENKKRKV